MNKIFLGIISITISFSAFSQDESFGTASFHYTPGGRLIVQIDAIGLPETRMNREGGLLTSYCVNSILIKQNSGYNFFQTFQLDGSTVKHLNQGGKSGVYNLSLVDGHLKAMLNYPIENKPNGIKMFLTVGRAFGPTAEEINSWGTPICEFTGPELYTFGQVQILRGESLEIELEYEP